MSHCWSGAPFFSFNWMRNTLLLFLDHRGVFTSLHVCVHVQSLQSCQTLCDSMDCSPPGSSVQGILQARRLEGLPFPSPRDLPNLEIKLVSDFVSCIAGGFFTHWATWEALYSITLTKMRNSFGKEGSKIGSVLLFFCLLGSRCLLDKRKDLLALGMLSLGLQGEVRGGNFQRSGPLKSGWYLKPWGPVYSWDPRLIQKSAFTVRRKEGARGKARKHHLVKTE